MKPYDLVPRFLVDALVEVTRREKDWLRWEYAEPTDAEKILGMPLPADRRGYKLTFAPGIGLGPLWRIAGKPTASDLVGFKALGAWASDRPKTFIPTPEQCEALENVDVNLTLADYAQPFPALCVKLPPGRYDPFWAVLVHLDETGGPTRMLSLSLFSKGNTNDIVTVVAEGHPIEKSLQRFDEECGNVQHIAPQVQRVAINCCLLLANDPNLRVAYSYPIERASDERLAVDLTTERGRKAQLRMLSSPMTVSFSQEIRVRHVERPSPVDGVPTGRTMPIHWRRGHWAMQPHGPKNALRKRIFRPPVLVHSEQFGGDLRDTGATYRG